jgi:hypothetical protein
MEKGEVFIPRRTGFVKGKSSPGDSLGKQATVLGVKSQRIELQKRKLLRAELLYRALKRGELKKGNG